MPWVSGDHGCSRASSKFHNKAVKYLSTSHACFSSSTEFFCSEKPGHIYCACLFYSWLFTFSVGNCFDRKEYFYLCIILIEKRVNILLLSKDITTSGVSHSEILLEYACPHKDIQCSCCQQAIDIFMERM